MPGTWYVEERELFGNDSYRVDWISEPLSESEAVQLCDHMNKAYPESSFVIQSESIVEVS